MKYDIVPVIDSYDLLDEIKKETNLFDDVDSLADFIWPGDFMNDCCKRLYLEDETEDERLDYIINFIKNRVPVSCSYVLIDVSW